MGSSAAIRGAAGLLAGIAFGTAIGVCATVVWAANGGGYDRVALQLWEVWALYLAAGGLGGVGMGLLFPITKSRRGAQAASVVGFTPFYIGAGYLLDPNPTTILIGCIAGVVFGIAVGPQFLERATEGLGPGERRRYSISPD